MSIGTFVSKILASHDSLKYFCSVYSNLGLGFASGFLIIVAEIIFAKLTRPRFRFITTGCGAILLLLTLSAILTTVTVLMMIQEIQNYNPTVDYQFKTGKCHLLFIHSPISWIIAGSLEILFSVSVNFSHKILVTKSQIF